MRSGRKTFLKLAFALCCAMAWPVLHAAEAPASKASAPEAIEFSPTTSTAPRIPRPGSKNDDLSRRFGNVREIAPGAAPELTAPIAPMTATPSRAAAEKYLREWDKKKNWLVPREDKQDATEAVTKKDETETDLLAEKSKGVMDDFISGKSEKSKASEQQKSRDLDRDRDHRDNFSSPSRIANRLNDRRDGNRDKDDDRDGRDPNDNTESNGLAQFDLKNFIREQNGAPSFLKDSQLPKASQLFRSEIGNNYSETQQFDTKERAQRDARSAEFMQMLKPRGGGPFIGANDPINSPDLTRREMNPVTPRPMESSAIRSSPFDSGPSSPVSRIQENSMFGVTGPAAASSLSPAMNAPLPAPSPHVQRIVIEPPKRPGF